MGFTDSAFHRLHAGLEVVALYVAWVWDKYFSHSAPIETNLLRSPALPPFSDPVSGSCFGRDGHQGLLQFYEMLTPRIRAAHGLLPVKGQQQVVEALHHNPARRGCASTPWGAAARRPLL